MPILLPYIQQDEMRPFVVAGATRQPELAGVPTLTEIGLDGFPPETWAGILAPGGTPPEIVAKLNSAINDAMHTAEITASFAKLGFHAASGSAKDFADLVAMDTRKWAEVVKLTSIKID
jgi:tripartite-type tricarboxylate transporter receptor subunit TctC